MRKIEEVLRLKYEVGLTHRAIAQSCSISPSTVSEYVTHAKAAGLSWPLPEGLSDKALEELLFPQRGPASGAKTPQPDWAAVHKELSGKSVTLSLLWVEYRQEHPQGYSYSQFCYHYRHWAKQLNPMMRQKHKAGEKLFIDYAGQKASVVDPETGGVWQAEVFVAVLGASNYTYVEAHRSQSLPNWIGAHVRALAFLGGRPEVLVPDNLKAGVKSPHRYEPDINPTYQDFAQHYGLAVVPARTFFSLAELNRAIRALLDELNNRPMRHLGQSRRQLFESLDQPALSPLPARPYQFARWKKARVHIDYHVAFDKHFYSVPYTLKGKEVMVRATEKTVEIFYQRTWQASHPRSQAQGRFSTQREHMPPAHQKLSDWSPERFQRWAQEIGPHTTQLIAAVLESRHHPQQAYRSCLGILGLGKRYTNKRLEAACRRALPAGIRSYKGIHNILKNKLDQLEADDPPTAPLPAHANIRGEGYYN
jgi:transposase